MRKPADPTTLLRALAHPIRQELLDRLAVGPATSAMLARAMSSNTGVLSYHLRELAAAGLIVRDDEHSRGRKLYWMPTETQITHDDPSRSAPEVRDLAHAAVATELARTVQSIRTYVDRDDIDDEWRDAALFSRSNLRLTPGQLLAMNDEYLAFVDRWIAAATDGEGQHVRIRHFAYPDPPARGPTEEQS